MKKIFVSAALFLAFNAFAQVKTHEVQPKETVYGISRKYNITQEELKQANPFLNERGLNIGDVLNIPGQIVESHEIPVQEIEDHEDNDFYYHVILPKETLYSLAKKYNTSQETIKSLNPFIDERGLNINDVVRFPKTKTNAQNVTVTVTDGSTTEQVVEEPIKTKDTPLETNVPEGMHLVKKGETVYSIAKQYDLKIADIYAYNRNVQSEGLKVGAMLQIPEKKKIVIPEGKPYFEHKVEAKETIYSLLRKYEVSLDGLLAENPELQNGLQEGMTLRIPLAKGANIETEPRLVASNSAHFADEEINIVWMMPFFLDTPNSHKGERKVAQDFYMGAQVALDRLMSEGKNINIEIVDVQGDKKNLDTFLDSDKFHKADAIVGPFFKENIVHVAQKLENTNIPVFSPLTSSDDLNIYKNVYMTTPKDEYAADIIVEEMAKAYNGTQEVKILTTSRDKNIAEYVQAKFLERFGDARVTLTKNHNDLKLVEHKTVTTIGEGEEAQEVEEITYDPILAVLATENNKVGKQFVNTIKEQNASSMNGFSVFFVPALDVFSTSNVENINALKEIGFTYTATRMVNTFGKNEKAIMKDFKDKYCSVPSKYMAIGYDVVYDVVDRMDKNGKISAMDAKRSATRLSSKIGYDTTDNGSAKINKELRVIRLKK